MDQNLIYAKTPSGDEAVRQSTRVVQRNLRMVLVQVDGKLTVGELATKIGNPKMVEQSLSELEEGGFIAPVLEAASVWEEAKRKIAERAALAPASQFSTFGPREGAGPQSQPQASDSGSIPSVFSTFGRSAVPSETSDEEEEERSLIAKLSGALTISESTVEPARPPLRIKPGMVVAGVLGLLAAVFLALFLFPYNSYRQDVEAALARAFVAPVKVDNIGFSLSPSPGLAIQGVRVGSQGESRIAEIRLSSPFALFGSGPKTLAGVEMVGLRFSPDQLAALVAAPSGAASGLIVTHATLKHAALVVAGGGLEGLGGEVHFKQGGGLEKLSLRSEDRSLTVEGLPSALGLALSVEAHGWKPLPEKPYVFESLQAKGLLRKGKLVLQDVDTAFLGGLMRGNVLLDWSSGLAVAADLALQRLNASRAAELFGPPLKIAGDLGGNAKLRGVAQDWAGLGGVLEGTMDIELSRGALQGLDLGEAARRGAGRSTRSGQTKFDTLKGFLRFGGGQVSGSDFKLTAGLMSAEGQFTAGAGGKVTGAATVAIQSTVSTVRVPVRISGELPDLTAAAGR